MAQIKSTSETKVLTISKWLGVNENPDGDTKLKPGEAANMRNWRVTKDNHLQVRPGYGPVAELGESPVLGMWSGFVAGSRIFAAVCGGSLYKIVEGGKVIIGTVSGSYAHFFGFNEKLYLLTGSKYYVYDGAALSEVAGYRPLVSVSTLPGGGGTSLEQVNKLTGAKRARFSPDGTAAVFQLPETGLISVDYVKKTADGTEYAPMADEGETPVGDYTLDLTNGTVTFLSVPESGTDSIEIGWTGPASGRTRIEAMRFSETYNGATDTRVFIYGDGSNKAFYSGLDYNGKPTAEYFPDMNEIAVDSANTPITAMIKHYDSLLAFKSDGAFITNYGSMSLADGSTAAAFYTTALNREIGNAALGQARLVKNNPYTLFGRSAYEWQLSSYAAKDERNAKRKSERVVKTLGELDLSKAICFDDEYNTEYYIAQGGKCAVYNYTADAWYVYGNIPASCFCSIDGSLYFGTSGGKIMELSRSYRNDDGADIDAYWESGAMDFSKDYRLKYSTDIWLALKPESQARITVTAQSNRKGDYEEKVVASALSTFSNVDFNHFSFNTNRQPQVERMKLKVKKFTFYRLILTSVSKSATATVLGTDIKVRYSGTVK